MAAKQRGIPFVEFLSRVLKVKLTPAQFVTYAVACDGAEPAQLVGSQRDIAREIFGNVETVPPIARSVFVMVKGARVGGTYLAALRMLHLALTLPLTTLAPGELASALMVAPDTRLARQALRYALGAAREHKDIARRIRATNTDSFTLERDDGRTVVIECLPGTRGGSALRGRSLVGVQFTEFAFVRDADYVVNDAELFKAVAPRVLPGGQIIIESTPFAESGLLFELYTANHGAPTSVLAARCPTRLMRPDAQTAATVERERARDPENAAREFDAVFMSAGSSRFFDPLTVDRAVDPSLALPALLSAGAQLGAAMDLGLTRDSATDAIVSRVGTMHRLVMLRELRPEKGNPLKLSAVIDAFAADARQFGVTKFLADGWAREPAREYTDSHKLTIESAPEGQQGKQLTYIHTRKLLSEGRLAIPNLPRLVNQFKAVLSRPTPGGGLQITSPRRAGQGHGDALSAVILACFAASNAAPAAPIQRARIHTRSGGQYWEAAPPLYGHPGDATGYDRQLTNYANSLKGR